MNAEPIHATVGTMDLTPTRFTTVHDTTVTVAVNSAAEARHAVKELRHLKRELAHRKRIVQAAASRARTRERREGRRKPQPVAASFFDFVGKAIGSLTGTFRPEVRRHAPRSAADLEAELKRIDALARSIDGTRLEIEGRLVQQG